MSRVSQRLGALGLAAGISAGCYSGGADDAANADAASPSKIGSGSGDAGSIDGAGSRIDVAESNERDIGTATPSSCRARGNGLTDCGASGESCCASSVVPGGTFYRTYAVLDAGTTAQADPATVSDFRLDKYAVTVARFRQFVNAWNGGAGYVPPAGSGKHSHLDAGKGLANSDANTSTLSETGWVTSDDSRVAPTNANLACASKLATWTASAGSNETLPINCVTWWESYAFCIWDGGFLPSESEREYAAAGGSQQRQYPWGSIDPGTTNEYAIFGCHYPLGSGSCAGGAAPVGTATMGAGRWGHFDLAGNVNEWSLDWFGGYSGSCTNCANLTGGSYRVVRGGYYDSAASYMPATSRGDDPPADRSVCIGFRCARTP